MVRSKNLFLKLGSKKIAELERI